MAENRRGLGRGLSALLGEAEEIAHAVDVTGLDRRGHAVGEVAGEGDRGGGEEGCEELF